MIAEASIIPTAARHGAIELRNVSKQYRLWHRAGQSRWKRLARLFVPQPAAAKTERGAGEIFPALKNISFEIARGESVGIIGRNGCGKSTLLQILAGVMKPTSGGGTVNGTLAALLDLGAGFHPDFTGRENISLNNSIFGLTRGAARVRMERIEAFADIGRFMDEPIRTYSAGMLLRLGFACAIAVDPDVFLVDEALAVGDIFFQQKCFEYMRGEMKGRTRVIVSHDMHAITTLCSRVLVLEAGRLVFDGPPLDAVELYTKSLHDTHAGTAKNGRPRPQRISSDAPAFVQPAEWRLISPESTGGAGDLHIVKTEVRVNGEAFASVIKPGATVSIRALVECQKNLSHVLFGYLVRDRTSREIFGENSASLPEGIVAVETGHAEFAFQFTWPEVQPGEYFLTLGVGEGRDAFRHRVQCWAHNLHLFNAITPGRTVHCIFNNPLRGFAYLPLADATVETELAPSSS